jgi:TetR/AcrR family transcriptional repressor of nem operon
MFCSEIERDGRMCLTGILGAEAGGLPSEVVEEIETFFRRCIDHLRWIGGPDFVARAFHVMVALEGGSSPHGARGDISAFDHATRRSCGQSCN